MSAPHFDDDRPRECRLCEHPAGDHSFDGSRGAYACLECGCSAKLDQFRLAKKGKRLGRQMTTIQAPQRTIPLGEQQRGQNGTMIRVRRVTKAYGLPFIARYCVEWQTTQMGAPAFWYYADWAEANTDALRLLGERKG